MRWRSVWCVAMMRMAVVEVGLVLPSTCIVGVSGYEGGGAGRWVVGYSGNVWNFGLALSFNLLDRGFGMCNGGCSGRMGYPVVTY
ncbi:Hypothetical predicted protein [Olea europaea subsp. europaea]|uniref:Secreted protein n=1 Tax=Olea europaea subsp. europaea TaxID=158383 RepID=A0A8S0UV15_OLEEU|nr:Hypothetical predicted protein [Olea europaea subsp. europaea]